jgi:hypothetical protein
VALIVIFIILVATVHCEAAQSGTNEIANVNPIVTASAGFGGTISPNGVFSISYGDSQVFTVTPDNGYVINQVLINGTSALQHGIAHTYSFTVQNVTGTTTISATFIPSGGPGLPPSYPNLLNLAVVLVVLVLSLLAVAMLKKRKHQRAQRKLCIKAKTCITMVTK